MFDFLHKTFHGKRVFLTGHTGFKGAWMLQLLHILGAEVYGYSLSPEHENDLFCEIDGSRLCKYSQYGDILSFDVLEKTMLDFRPDFVFHLAAQALVRPSYVTPVQTFATNAMGTAHVLDVLRRLDKPCIGLMITTDKVYENPERGEPFVEADKLGGYDPYSASKAAAEIVIASYRQSFFNSAQYDLHGKAIASVRAGNVIGGGDRSLDRIVPDIVRAIERGEPVVLRNPYAIRPWQHVLEPLGAYLLLAARMQERPVELSAAFNFGPDKADEKTVEELTQIFLEVFSCSGQYRKADVSPDLHEAKLLMLDSTKAKTELNWQPRLHAEEAIRWTAEWYADKKHKAADKCRMQIERYFSFT